MATTQRNVLRSLPALIALFFALLMPSPGSFAAPAMSASATVGISAGQSVSAPADEPARLTEPVPPPAAEPVSGDPVTVEARVLTTQLPAGPTGSRAPPSALV
jgi:hypothetical protein